ncbi:MAG TPA: hypothetical protein VE175_13160, partial [Woeseiaceae bacterium]|nr:hypothetical protein [Woeseiaceae bacterium]
CKEFDANFVRVGAEWVCACGLTAALSYESLGGDRASPGSAFRTPLATLHAFQGWADQFLVTPDAGVRDVQGRLSYPISRWRLQAVYHDFSAEDGRDGYGRELDLAAARNLGERYELLVKSAYFDARQAGFTDTRKLWIMLTAAW